MADAKEWFAIQGVPMEFANLEMATDKAVDLAGGSEAAFEILRIVATPVRCVKRRVSIEQTDLTSDSVI